MSTVRDEEIKKLKSDKAFWSQCRSCAGTGKKTEETIVCVECLGSGRVELNSEDADWFSRVADMMKPVAKRYGRNVFALAMRHGMMQGCLTQIAAMNPPPKVAAAMQFITQAFNMTFSEAMKHYRISDEVLKSCKEDIERMGAMAQAANEGAARTPGGIILPS